MAERSRFGKADLDAEGVSQSLCVHMVVMMERCTAYDDDG